MVNYPQAVLNLILELVFPKICLGCGKFTQTEDFDYFCRRCFGEIKVKDIFECVGCKTKSKYGLTCLHCHKANYLDQLLIVTDLKDQRVDKIIKTFKYGFIQDLALPISILARKYIKKLSSKGFKVFEDNPLLLSVPLHKRRLNWRGFNQAELIAERIADAYHISCNSDVLVRISNPKHQADIINRQERLINISGGFDVIDKKIIEGRNIILFDDICTSGATLNECAKVLKEGEAKRVIGFVIARG